MLTSKGNNFKEEREPWRHPARPGENATYIPWATECQRTRKRETTSCVRKPASRAGGSKGHGDQFLLLLFSDGGGDKEDKSSLEGTEDLPELFSFTVRTTVSAGIHE